MLWGKRTASLSLALTLLLCGCASDEARNRQDILTEIQTEDEETFEAATGDVTRAASITMESVYTQRQSLCAPENDLYLEEVLVKTDDAVAEGEPIAVFRRPSSQAELQKAELELQRAQEEQESRLEALEDAVDTAAAFGGARLELAQLEYDRAVYVFQRELDTLQAAVDEKKSAFEPVVLQAPYDCVIESTPHLFDQQEVDMSTVIVTVKRASSLVLVGEDLSNSFRYGSVVEVEYGSRNARKTVQGKIVNTALLLGEEGQSFCVVLQESIAQEELITPTANVEYLQLRDALTVPRSAVRTENHLSYVQILVDGVAHKRYIVKGVNVGNINSTRTMVLAGLEPGQQVILN